MNYSNYLNYSNSNRNQIITGFVLGIFWFVVDKVVNGSFNRLNGERLSVGKRQRFVVGMKNHHLSLVPSKT